tara:strand:- start:381 stop:611 length:231 start_codon:yes stop_codon:yes gene_type:complete
MNKKEKWDGRSRPTNDKYKKEYDRIFNPVAKEVRTPKFKSQVVEDKTKYNRKKEKTTSEVLMEGFLEEQRMLEEED